MKYKQGEKMIVEITEVKENSYVLNRIGEVESIEAKIRRQAAEITRLLAENKKLKAENEKMLVKIDAYELYDDQHEEEYNQAFNQGAEAAWELASKITLYGEGAYSGKELKEIFDCTHTQEIIKNNTYHEAAAKVAEWKETNEKVKTGDILEDICDSNIKCIVTNLYPNNKAYLVFDDGTAGMHKLDNFKKTGRHIDIDGFLKQIRGEKNE